MLVTVVADKKKYKKNTVLFVWELEGGGGVPRHAFPAQRLHALARVLIYRRTAAGQKIRVLVTSIALTCYSVAVTGQCAVFTFGF